MASDQLRTDREVFVGAGLARPCLDIGDWGSNGKLAQLPPRPRRGLEAPRLYGDTGLSAAFESVENWSGKDRADENFPVGSALISARLRPHVHAFYQFARNADDIADSPTLAAADKVRRLDRMAAILDGAPGDDSPLSMPRTFVIETGFGGL